MEPVHIFFINTMADYIHQRSTTVPDHIDRSKLQMYAKEHQLEPIFYKQTNLSEFREGFLAQLNICLRQELVYEEIRSALKGIPFFTLKGTAIAKYYPDPELRTMSDLDFVVGPDNREKADERLRKLGAEMLKQSEGEWIYQYREVVIELHSRLVYGYSNATTEEAQRTFFNNCWDYYRDGSIDFNFHVLFLFMHLRKHIMETGIGFRQFMDIAFIIRNAQPDWDWIKTKAEEINLFLFMRTALSMIEKWFDVPSPFEKVEISEAFYEEATLHIFDDGVFGFENIKNRNNRAINERASKKNPLYGINYFLEQFFWPYEKLILMPEYKWLINKKWLLPVAWGYRSVKKWKNRDVLIMRYFASGKSVKERYEYLNQWNVEDPDDQGNNQ